MIVKCLESFFIPPKIELRCLDEQIVRDFEYTLMSTFIMHYHHHFYRFLYSLSHHRFLFVERSEILTINVWLPPFLSELSRSPKHLFSLMFICIISVLLIRFLGLKHDHHLPHNFHGLFSSYSSLSSSLSRF